MLYISEKLKEREKSLIISLIALLFRNDCILLPHQKNVFLPLTDGRVSHVEA